MRVTLAAILILLSPAAAQAQLNVSLKASNVWTSVPQLENAFGAEVSATNLVTRRVGWTMTYSAHWNNSDGFGSACSGLISPGEDCSARPLEVERSLEFFSIMALLRPVEFKRWTLDMGAGPAKHKFDYEDREPDTGRRSGAESAVIRIRGTCRAKINPKEKAAEP
jgi:hypothetical protein